MAEKKQNLNHVANGLTTFIGDDPVGLDSKSKDWLGFENYASVFADSVLNTDGPLSIGVFGGWGTGKTSLMNLVKNCIEEEKKTKKTITAWFNAWKYESDTHPVIPLCATIIKAIDAQKSILGKCYESLKEALQAVAYGFSIKAKVKVPMMVELDASVSGKDAINRADDLGKNKILDESLYSNAFNQLDEASALLKKLGDRKIVVFIDDLDRCFPGNAVKLIESIKLVLHQPGFVFIFGLDKDTISSYVSRRFSEDTGISGNIYLDKLFQVSFFLPDYSSRIEDYAKHLVETFLDEQKVTDFQPLFPAIGTFCRNNPRSVKRFLNNMLVAQARAVTMGQKKDIPIINFGLELALQMHWSIVADAIRNNDDNICSKLSEEIYEDENKVIKAIGGLAENKDNVDRNRQVYRLILKDRSLRGLITSTAARDWLKSMTQPASEAPTESTNIAGNDCVVDTNGISYEKIRRAKIRDAGRIYGTVKESDWFKEKLENIFPDSYKDILAGSEGALGYRDDYKGNVLGEIHHSDGSTIYTMEIPEGDRRVYRFVNKEGVELLD